MSKLNEGKMLSMFDSSPEKLQEWLSGLSDEEKAQYRDFALKEKEKREKVNASIKAEEERRANLSPEERAREDRNFKVGCGAILVVIICFFAWLFWPKSEEEIARENQIKAEQQAAKQAAKEKAAEEAAVQKAIDEQNAKAAFKSWNDSVQEYIRSVDSDWDLLWKGTATAMQNQSMDVYTAYNNIDKLHKRLDSTWQKFSRLSTPSELSEEQQDKLKDACNKYTTWVYCRREACDKFKEMLNTGNFAPAKVKDMTDTINSGDALAVEALANVLDVENQLGLLENK